MGFFFSARQNWSSSQALSRKPFKSSLRILFTVNMSSKKDKAKEKIEVDAKKTKEDAKKVGGDLKKAGKKGAEEVKKVGEEVKAKLHKKS